MDAALLPGLSTCASRPCCSPRFACPRSSPPAVLGSGRRGHSGICCAVQLAPSCRARRRHVAVSPRATFDLCRLRRHLGPSTCPCRRPCSTARATRSRASSSSSETQGSRFLRAAAARRSPVRRRGCCCALVLLAAAWSSRRARARDRQPDVNNGFHWSLCCCTHLVVNVLDVGVVGTGCRAGPTPSAASCATCCPAHGAAWRLSPRWNGSATWSGGSSPAGAPAARGSGEARRGGQRQVP